MGVQTFPTTTTLVLRRRLLPLPLSLPLPLPLPLLPRQLLLLRNCAIGLVWSLRSEVANGNESLLLFLLLLQIRTRPQLCARTPA
jgi:hypothetical protein